MTTFEAPTIEYGPLTPLLIVFGVALAGVLVEAFVPRARRYLVQTVLAAVGLLAALVATVVVATDAPERADGAAHGSIVAAGAIAVDGPSLFIWGVLLVLSLVSVLLFAERHLDGGLTAFAGQAAALPGTEAEREASTRGLEHTEVYPLMLFSVTGMMLFPAANDLLTMFVALEVLSLPLYLLSGLARRRRLLSQEAALKYFMLGAFSSGFFIYGIALVYGYAGSTNLAAIAEAITGRLGSEGLLLGGIALMSVGMLFKVSAVPFHSWTPDVYQGAPTAVTGFMAACTKVAAFGAMLRLFYVAFGAAERDWTPMIWIIAILTMAVGSVFALSQTDIKRMLAYSSIAHAGFILTAMVTSTQADARLLSISGVLFYLLAYGFTTIGAFAVVSLVRERDAADNVTGEATHLSQWAGLGQRSPWLAGVFTLFLLAFAGIPLTSGFTGKYAVFLAAVEGGYAWLAVIGVLVSVITAFFYVRVIVLMYFSGGPAATGPATSTAVALPSPLMGAAIAIGAAVTVLLGVLPAPVLDLAVSTVALP
jgi:NADH-quinone oxidoreductase subunit N